MRSRRVPVLRLGSRGPGGDARSLRLCSPSVRKRSQASASVRKRPQAFASVRECRRVSRIVGSRKSSRNAELSSLFSLSVPTASTVTGIGGGRKTQTCRHFWTRLGSSRLKSVNGHRDRGGSWSQNADLSSLLGSSRVFAFQVSTVTGIGGGVVVAKRRPVVTFGLVSGLRVSKVSTVTGIRGGVVVAKRRPVVTFGLVSGLRVSKVSTVTGLRGGVVVAKRRPVVTVGLVSGLRVSKCQRSQGSGGVVVAKRRPVVTFGLASGERNGERKGERREEKREMRGEKRGDRREEESG